jgi:cell division control protein 6
MEIQPFLFQIIMMSTDKLLTDIFRKALSGKSLFKNRDVLRAEYIPPRLPFREEQITTIAQILSPLLHGSKCSNLLLYGKTGTGKTAVARYVLQKLQETASTQNIPLISAYTNTRVAGTEYRTLYDIARHVSVDIPFTGLALREASERILNKIDLMSSNAVFVLDEVDYLVKNYGDNLLYELTRANERLKKGSISLIGISNDLKFKELLDPRVLSALSEEEIVFPPYTAEELRVILKERANLAFNEGVIDDAAINLCAALAAQEHGDARRAVDLLRVAGEVAEREGASIVQEIHVRLALQKIDQDRMVDALTSLPIQQKLILITILDSGEGSSTGEIYTKYSNLCKKLGIEVLTQRRVSGLISELDMLGLVSASTVSKGRYGRTKKVKPLVGFDLVKEVYLNDPLLSQLFS